MIILNKNIIITGVLAVATLGFAIGSYQTYTQVNTLKSEITAANDSTAALKTQKQTSKNITRSDPNAPTIKITDTRESMYKGDTQTAVLMDSLENILTYKSGKDLKVSYTKYKDSIKGSVWKDLYGTVKSTGEPAIVEFAAQIDTLKKTGSVNDDIQIVSVGDKYIVTLTAEQGGDASAGAVNGSNIYEFEATPIEGGFSVKLAKQLARVDN